MTVEVGVSVIAMVGVSLGVIVIASGVKVNGSDVTVPNIMRGVAVTIPGVRVGMVVHTGNGCGFTLQSIQAESKIGNMITTRLFFMSGSLFALLYPVLAF